MTTSISPTSIVVEVLRDDNYDDWSACMKSYMLSQELWDFIEPADHQEGDPKALIKKNAAALHAIQISCAPHMLSKIRSITSAKVAWDTLASLQQQHSQSHKEQSVEAELSGSSEDDGPLLDLYKYAHEGDWDATKNYLSRYPNARKAKIRPYGGTALHVAAWAGNLKIVEELVQLISDEKELEIQDDQGYTALCRAAMVGITKMAECLVSKNKNSVTLLNNYRSFPFVEACVANHKDMALYLYSVTPFEFLCRDNGIHGSYFLEQAIGAQMFDIAFDLLHRFPSLTTATDDVFKSNDLNFLSTMAGSFPSGGRLAYWQQLIYSCIRIQPIAATNDTARIYMPDQSLGESKNIVLQVLSKLRGFAINFLAFLGIKQIYDLKKIHIYSNQLLQCMCGYISTLDYEEFLKADVVGAFHIAVRNGMIEFIIEMIKTCPHLMSSENGDGRNLIMSSIANRQEKVFSLFYGLEESRARFVSLVDSLGNTLLHLAAKLSPPSRLARISGAAL